MYVKVDYNVENQTCKLIHQLFNVIKLFHETLQKILKLCQSINACNVNKGTNNKIKAICTDIYHSYNDQNRIDLTLFDILGTCMDCKYFIQQISVDISVI